MEEGRSQTEALLREIAENTAILGAFLQGTQPVEDYPWGCNKFETDGTNCASGKPDPLSAGTAINGTTSRRNSAKQRPITGWTTTRPNGVCSVQWSGHRAD